jgi:hypothetical protein
LQQRRKKKRNGSRPFRTALDRSDGKKFDEMFDVPRFYISACSYSVEYVRLYSMPMSILFHHFKQLTKCIEQVEQIEAKVERLLLLKRKRRETPAVLSPAVKLLL